MGIFNRLFAGKEENLPPFDLALFGADMHSHLIPGIDDGSRSMDETIAMLAKFESLGYKKVITTPHIMSDYYRNTPEIIQEGLEQVRSTAKQLNLSIEIDAAAEYYFDEALLDRLKRKERLLTFGDNCVLFEFSFHAEPNHVDQLIFEMLTQGYRPVLAHVERYTHLFGKAKRAIEWRKRGVLLQLNLNSLTGHYGPDVQKQARYFVDEGAIDFVGTDCHRMDHLLLLQNNLRNPYFQKLANLALRNRSLLD